MTFESHPWFDLNFMQILSVIVEFNSNLEFDFFVTNLIVEFNLNHRTAIQFDNENDFGICCGAGYSTVNDLIF